MIIVEGPDGSGKSTLVEWILNTHNLKEGKRSTRNRDEIYKTTRADTWCALYHEMLATEPPVVWDRLGIFSDPIYAYAGVPVDRKCGFTLSEIIVYQDVLEHMGVVIVCLPPIDVVVKNSLRSHQLKNVVRKTPEIYHEYQRLAGKYFTYDYTKDPRDYIDLLITNHLDRRKERELVARTRHL